MLFGMADLKEQVALTELHTRLTSKYSDVLPDRVSSVIDSAHARFEESRIRDFVPLLVERRARAELGLASSALVISS
jgi:hypothetical protein